MAIFGSISIAQIIALLLVNTIGVACLVLVFFLMKRDTPTPKEKMFVSLGLGLIGISLVGVVLVDMGISSWIQSDNSGAVFAFLPLCICLPPFVFPVTVAGSYIQLIYKDKLQKYVSSAAKDNFN
jgi:hypothetical protein